MRRITTALALALLCACTRQPAAPKEPAGAAEKASELATTPEQQRLWKEAAARKHQGLETVSRPDDPVVDRKHAEASQQKVAQKVPQIPASVRGAVIVMTPGGDFAPYAGTARIRSIQGERIELDLAAPQARTIALVARAAGRSLRMRAGEQAQVEYRSQSDPHDRQEILAIRAAGGDGVVSVTDSDTQPVNVSVRLFGLVARQVGEAQNSRMNVEVRVGNAVRVLRPGDIADVGGLTVGIKASNAYGPSEMHAVESNPFALDLIAWPAETPRPIQ